MPAYPCCFQLVEASEAHHVIILCSHFLFLYCIVCTVLYDLFHIRIFKQFWSGNSDVWIFFAQAAIGDWWITGYSLIWRVDISERVVSVEEVGSWVLKQYFVLIFRRDTSCAIYLFNAFCFNKRQCNCGFRLLLFFYITELERILIASFPFFLLGRENRIWVLGTTICYTLPIELTPFCIIASFPIQWILWCLFFWCLSASKCV